MFPVLGQTPNILCICKDDSPLNPIENIETRLSLGFLHLVIDKMFFCMKPNSRLGVFFLISVFIETMDILSSTFNIWLMMKTGFAVEGSLFLLLKVA